MPINAGPLPDDVDTLRRMLVAEREAHAAREAELAAAKAGLVTKTLEIEKLKIQIARLRRQQFGRSSEKIDRIIEQLELMLDELETEAASGPAAVEPAATATDDESAATRKKSPGRRPLPDHLPCRKIVHTPDCTCPACGGVMRQVGEDISDVLDYIPGRFEIIRHIRPAFSCRVCESMVQMPMPSLPIERGRPSAGLLAHILVSKYCDHTPLYRQAGIYAREGVDLDRAVMANWVGKSVWIAAPLVEAIGDHVMAAAALHGDDTPVPVLAPGAGKTKTGRLWVYLRDERPHAGPAPPAVIYRYSPDRKGEHVGDREGDIYELFCTAQELGTHFLVRSCVDRLAGDGTHTIADEMKDVAVAGQHHVEVCDSKGRVGTAAVEIRYRSIHVLPPIGKQKRYPALTLTVLHAQECEEPTDRPRIDWKLITDLPIQSHEAAIEKLRWYALRWKIEVFHKILKSGCRAEEARLRTAERLVKLISVFCILSWRVFWMTMINRSVPDAEPGLALTMVETKLLDQLVSDNTNRSPHGKALSTYLTKIARLGGYLARASDPPPGNTVMWRGLTRLTDIKLGAMLAASACG